MSIKVSPSILSADFANLEKDCQMVIDAGFDATGVAKYALLEPAVNVASLEQVFIVTQYNVG